MMKATKFIVRFIASFLIGIVALVLVVLIAIQVPFVKGKIVQIAVNEVNKILEAELSVGKLEGNFFNGIQLSDVLLRSMEGDTITFIPRIELGYQLMPLLNGEIFIEKVNINDPYVYLAQLPDSTWNLQYIVIPSEDTDTTPSNFNMKILANSVSLNNGYVRISAYNDKIPDTVESLFLDVSGSYSSKKQWLNLKELRFFTTHPEVVLQTLSLEMKADIERIELNDLLLQTAQSQIIGGGTYKFSKKEKSSVEIVTLPIIIEEFRAFLPENFYTKATPTLKLVGDIENDKLNLDLSIQDSAQSINLKVFAEKLLAYLSDSTIVPTYNLDLDIKQVDLRYWLDNSEMNYLINGDLIAKGEGFNPETMKANVSGNFGDIVLYNNPVKELNLLIDYLAGDVNGVINGSGSFGSLHLVSKLQQILSQNPKYQANLTVRKLDISSFLGNMDYKTDIDLNANVRGSSFDLNKLNATSHIVMMPSLVMGVQIDTLNSEIDINRQNIIVHNLFLKTLLAYLHVNGNYNLKGLSDLSLEFYTDSIDKFTQLLGIEDIQTSVDLKAHLTGQPDDLQSEIFLKLGNAQYQDILQLDSLYAIINGNIRNKSEINALADIYANQLVISNVSLDTIHLQAETDTKNFDLNLAVGSEDIQAELKSLVQLGNAINITLSDLMLAYKGYDWKQVSDTAYISIAENEYEVTDFHLVSDSSDIQSIFIDGKISQNAEQDLHLNIDKLDIGRLLRVFDIDQEITGFANLDVEVQGSPDMPSLKAVLDVDSTMFQDFRFDTIQANINLLENELSANLNIIPHALGRIIGEGNIPVEVRLDSMRFNIIPQKSDSVHASLLIEKLPFSILDIFLPADEISGNIESKINVNGTLGNPEIEGNLNIKDGKLKINQYGVNYNNIQVDAQLQNNEINVDTFFIRSREGSMTAHGGIKFASEFYKANLSSSELSILFNKFNPVDHKQFNVELSGNIDLGASADSVLFLGDLTIPGAYIFLPAVMNLLGDFSTSEVPKPLLVIEQEKLNQVEDSLIYSVSLVENESDTLSAPRFNFSNNLQGSLKIKIPRNTWIRNDDMRIELSGDVELLKHRDFFEIFGTIDVIRGQYNLLGKVFVIETGTLNFQGGEKLNPVLNIEAAYTFRDSERNKKNLNVLITGEMTEPQLSFTLEGQTISEGDAVSYILFGVNMDALTSGQQSSLNSTMDDSPGLAETVAASLISSQLTKFLGNAINVDYIDFSAGSSFDNASVTVGKYITNKLFISYQQHIGVLQDEDVARYEVTLEYELFRFLFLQLTDSPITSGIDLIFKVNSDTWFKNK